MHAQDLIINKCSHRQAVKTISENLPETNIKPPLAFIKESINSVDRGTFMVSPKEKEVLWVLYLVCKEKAYCFNTLFATINIVTQK
jgi:hypothetical protein